MRIRHVARKSKWLLLGISFLIALVIISHYAPLVHMKMDYPGDLTTLTLPERFLIVNYFIFFRFLTFLVPPLAIVFAISRFLKLKYLGLFAQCLAVPVVISIGISIFGFAWESKPDCKKMTSATKKDLNVILIVIDALRPDHLGFYGYERQTSPHIDALAQEGTVFKNCYSQATWSKPSVASMFTSLYGTMHGTVTYDGALPDEVTTLAEVLRSNGYITYGYVTNPHLKRLYNFDQGFDFFDEFPVRNTLYRAVLSELLLFKKMRERFRFPDRDSITVANRRILRWLKPYKNETFFMFIHYMDVHDPYQPPRPYDTMYPYIKGDKHSEEMSLYDGGIRFTDEHIGRLFAKLKSLGLYDKTLIIITADHGEAFGEHNNRKHGTTIYQEELKVPLIMRGPRFNSQGRVVEKQVRSIDIMPTVLDVLEIPCDIHLEGNSLLSLLDGENKQGVDPWKYIYIDHNQNNYFILKGIIEDNKWKYIVSEQAGKGDVETMVREELFNIADDPLEKNNVIEHERAILETMRSKLDFYKKYCSERKISTSRRKLDSETIKQLKALGYMQ